MRLTPRAVEIFLKRERIAAHLRAAETIDNGPGPRTQSPLCLLRQTVRHEKAEKCVGHVTQQLHSRATTVVW